MQFIKKEWRKERQKEIVIEKEYKKNNLRYSQKKKSITKIYK